MRTKFSQNGTNTLLLSIGGNTPGKPIKSLGIIIRRIGADAGIVLSPHDLRRSFAINNVRKGVPIPVIMKQGGWTNLKTFMAYLDSLTEDDYEGYSLGDDLLDDGGDK
jgi:integrase